MPAKSTLLLVEGPHDLEFCARLLKPSGFKRIRLFKELKDSYPFWSRAVPEKWPHADDLLARHPVPLFLANGQAHSVAVVNADGLEKIVTRLGFTLISLSTLPDAVGIILDADGVDPPEIRFDALLRQIRKYPDDIIRGLRWPENPGFVHDEPNETPRTGVFIMPDNENKGTVEDLLLDAALHAYPNLLLSAREYVNETSKNANLNAKDLKEFLKPAGSKKAIAAAMTSILKPEKAIQVSIQDNRWLESGSLCLPRIEKLGDFLRNLIGV